MSRTAVVINTLQQVQLFMTRNAGSLGNLNTSGSRQALDDLEASLSGHASNQTGATSGTTAAIARQRVLKSTLLVKYLRPISAIAEARLGQSPDFIAMKLPRSLKSTQQVLAAADSMGAAAAKYADTFIAAGMAPTFVSDLQTAAAEFKTGAADRSLTGNSKIGATSGLKLDTKEAHKVVKTLDALIEPALASNPVLLLQWKATKRFTGRPTAIASATIDSSATISTTETTSQTSTPAAGSAPAASAPPAAATTSAPVAAVAAGGVTTA